MIYCVDIRDYYSGDTIETILETENPDEAYAMADNWNRENNVTEDDIKSFYNEDVLIHEDGHIVKKFADVFQDDTKIKRAKDFLDYELQDDETNFGGISYVGETLKDFIAEVGLNENTAMRYVNASLKQCGIKPIQY